MAEEKKEVKASTETKTVKAKKETKAKKTTEKKVEKKEEKKVVVKANTSNKDIAKATAQDFSVILGPVITEKSMALTQNLNQVTFKVKPSANKTQVKLAFERIFKVKATHVSISTVRAKKTSRGGRYQGKIQGFKKAVVTVKSGEAIDLFKE